MMTVDFVIAVAYLRSDVLHGVLLVGTVVLIRRLGNLPLRRRGLKERKNSQMCSYSFILLNKTCKTRVAKS